MIAALDFEVSPARAEPGLSPGLHHIQEVLRAALARHELPSPEGLESSRPPPGTRFEGRRGPGPRAPRPRPR